MRNLPPVVSSWHARRFSSGSIWGFGFSTFTVSLRGGKSEGWSDPREAILPRRWGMVCANTGMWAVQQNQLPLAVLGPGPQWAPVPSPSATFFLPTFVLHRGAPVHPRGQPRTHGKLCSTHPSSTSGTWGRSLQSRKEGTWVDRPGRSEAHT